MTDKKSLSPMQSKKFLAYVISELTTKAGMFYMLMHLKAKLDWEELALLVAMLVSSASLTIGYVLGQASLDKYLSAAVEILDKEPKEKKDEK
jgi:hypothetical protein